MKISETFLTIVSRWSRLHELCALHCSFDRGRNEVVGMHSDRPINCADEDLFGRSAFIKNLAREIKSLSSEESIVIGLSGPWGSGKTSVINLVTQELRSERDESCLHPNDVIEVHFTPWNHINNETKDEFYFIKAFFDALRIQLTKDADGWYLKNEDITEFSDAIVEYLDLLDPGLLRTTAKIVSRRIRHRLLKARSSVEAAKRDVLNATSFLRENNIKILIVIDDIDRLPAEQIRLVFQLITVIADFDSVNYLIAYDEAIVSKALTEVQGIPGRKYLEKVIQVPLVMPKASSPAIRAEIIRRFEYVTYMGTQGEEEGSNDFSPIVSQVQSCFLSMRDINRLHNALRFKLRVLGEQINPVDLFAMEALRIICPEIIDWINEHRLKFCVYEARDNVTKLIDESTVKTLRQDFVSAFEDDVADPLAAFQIINLVFIMPGNNYSRSKISRAEVHQKKKVCDLEIFELYLNGDISTLTDMSDSLYGIIQSGGELEYSSYIFKAYKENRYLEAIESLLQVAEGLSPEAAEYALMAVAKNIKFADRSSVSFSENTRSIDLVEALLRSIAPSGQVVIDSIVTSVFTDSDETEVVSLAGFIIRQERAYGRHGFQGNGYERHIDISNLKIIEDRFVGAMAKLFEKGSLCFMENIYAQLVLLRQLDQSAFEKMLLKTSTNALCMVLIAEAYVGTWMGLGTNDLRSEYFTNDNILKQIDVAIVSKAEAALLSNKGFWSMHRDSRLKVAALILGVENNQYGALGESFDVETLESQLEEWRNKFFPNGEAER